MKSSDFGNRPPPLEPRPEPTPELLAAIAQERAFAAHLSARRPWATHAIVAVCVLVFLGQAWFSGSLDSDLRRDLLAAIGENQGHAVAQGQVWRLWSATFLHVSWWHIGGNMWALLALGPFLERVLGTARYLVLYAVCGLAGSLLSGALHPANVSVGASGAIWGLMAAAFALALRPHGLIPPLTAQNMKKRLVQPLLINVGLSLVPGVDAMAHLGGGLAGFLLVVSGAGLLGALPGYADAREPGGVRAAWTIAAVVLCLAMLASIGFVCVMAVILKLSGQA